MCLHFRAYTYTNVPTTVKSIIHQFFHHSFDHSSGAPKHNQPLRPLCHMLSTSWPFAISITNSMSYIVLTKNSCALAWSSTEITITYLYFLFFIIVKKVLWASLVSLCPAVSCCFDLWTVNDRVMISWMGEFCLTDTSMGTHTIQLCYSAEPKEKHWAWWNRLCVR